MMKMTKYMNAVTAENVTFAKKLFRFLKIHFNVLYVTGEFT